MDFYYKEIFMRLSKWFKLSFLTGLLLVTYPSFSNTYSTSVTPIKDTNIVAKTPEEDAKVTSSVKELIKRSKNLSKYDIKVTTNKGVVSLEGVVDSDSQASTLVEFAQSIIGVSDVDTSKLTVKDGTQPLADTFITAKIKGLMIREDLLGEKDIASMGTSIETKDGVVYITGLVDNKNQIDNAIEIIKKNVPEVKKVEYHVRKIVPLTSQNEARTPNTTETTQR